MVPSTKGVDLALGADGMGMCGIPSIHVRFNVVGCTFTWVLSQMGQAHLDGQVVMPATMMSLISTVAVILDSLMAADVVFSRP
jgi:hypothetical protein